MKKASKTCFSCSAKKNIAIGTTCILIGLFAIDVIFQGRVYQRLPVSWQNKLSEWIGR